MFSRAYLVLSCLPCSLTSATFSHVYLVVAVVVVVVVVLVDAAVVIVVVVVAVVVVVLVVDSFPFRQPPMATASKTAELHVKPPP